MKTKCILAKKKKRSYFANGKIRYIQGCRYGDVHAIFPSFNKVCEARVSEFPLNNNNANAEMKMTSLNLLIVEHAVQKLFIYVFTSQLINLHISQHICI